jgi:hypothetical protein
MCAQETESGARSVAEAVAHARAALDAAAACPPASSDARVDEHGVGVGAMMDDAPPPPLVASITHTPSEGAWTATVEAVLRGLSRAEEAVQPVRFLNHMP